MEGKINNYVLKLGKTYSGFLFTSNLVSLKYKMVYLEVNADTDIVIDSNKYKFSEFKKINRKTIDHSISNITQNSYKYGNIIISTRFNYDNIEEITYILIEDPNINDSLSVPVHYIIDNIFIGNLLSVIDESFIKNNNIKSIVRVFDDDLVELQDIDYLNIKIDDNLVVNITQYFDNFINFIKNQQKKEGNILIHCQHGSSRSCSFVIFYLMYFHKMGYSEALNFARSKRYGICPNNNFKNQLIKYFE